MPKKFDVYKIPELTREELIALQLTASETENARPEQQALAIKVIIEKLCLYDLNTYQPGSFDETAFLAGRVFVGKAIFIQRRRRVGDPENERKTNE